MLTFTLVDAKSQVTIKRSITVAEDVLSLNAYPVSKQVNIFVNRRTFRWRSYLVHDEGKPILLERNENKQFQDMQAVDDTLGKRNIRSGSPEVFCKKGVLRNFAKFTGKRLC